MDASIINQYSTGGAKLKAAIAGLSREQLLAVPIPGKWSIQQVVIHLADADLILSDRMKRVIAEEKPALLAFDQDAFLARLHCDAQPADEAAALFDQNRRLFARVLNALPAEIFERIGIHSERGPMTLRDILTMTVRHLDHHLKFIAEKRQRLVGSAV
jgi:uncharacterized damage-inducible protein DinB